MINDWSAMDSMHQTCILRTDDEILKMMYEVTLKQKEIQQLLKLEELFHSQYLTEELLNELISLYVRFVENIHHNQHPLRLYFMEKIRFVLSRPEVIRILEKESQSHNRSIRDTVRGVMGINEQEELEIKRMAEEAKAEIRQNHLINIRKDQNQEHLREKERNVKIEMQLRIMQEVEANMKNLRKDISQKQTNTQNHLAQIVSQQDQALDQRRANRKKRLRKKSADLTQKENVVEAQPIPKEELKKVQIEVNQTFQRFTRLTENRMKQENERKQNQGRVKFQIPLQINEEEEELFDQDNKAKEGHPTSFAKKKPMEKTEKKAKEQAKEKTEAVGIQNINPPEQKQGRVTVRINQYQQLEEQEFL